MEETKKNERLWYFNLQKDGDSAVVRLLHSSTKTIEKVTSHKVTIGDKKRRVRCIGADCPLCANQNVADERIYIHLFDYTDNKEKVWERTNKIIPQLETLEKDWAPLNTAVLKITRKGDAFPKYEVMPLNPMTYQAVECPIDVQLAKFYSMNRNKEEIETYLKTGEFPTKEWKPKQ